MTLRSLPLAFLLVGGTNAVAACGRQILARGHRIAHVLARSEPVAEWASGLGIVVSRRQSKAELLELPVVDHIVSIANDLILPPAMLARARGGAINCHNSRLPDYRGAFATSWAILAGESRHGVTWHFMTDAIDAGAPVASADVLIRTDDTARTLNARCLEQGIALFGETVLPRMEARTLAAGTAAIGRYYPVSRRAPALGLLDWSRPADQVMRGVRALDRGPIDNSFDLPKLLVGSSCWVVADVTERPDRWQPAGSLAVDPAGGLTLGTASHALSIGRLAACNGAAPLTTVAGPSSSGLRLLDAAGQMTAETLGGRLARSENTAVEQWCASAAAVDLPAGSEAALGASECNAGDWDAVARSLLRLKQASVGERCVRMLLETPGMRSVPASIAPLFLAARPLLLAGDETAAALAERLAAMDSTGGCLADMLLRRRGPQNGWPIRRVRLGSSRDDGCNWRLQIIGDVQAAL
jgi:methionyl-tRNA formyltransferase